jgi:IMP dehydrogenase
MKEFEDYIKKLEERSQRMIFHRVLIDVANGHQTKLLDLCIRAKQIEPELEIMVGNIANPKTYEWYTHYNCVDHIRVGIGGGNGCSTSVHTSIGFSNASLINETYQLKKQLSKYGDKKLPSIVADGGMKGYSDIIKALALGSDYVMVGSIFNKSIESAGDNYLYGIKLNKDLAMYLFDHKFPVTKYFRGMSTKAAQKAMGKTELKTSEGVIRYRKAEYHLSGWIENFEHYLRSAMSYTNAATLADFIGNVELITVSQNSLNRIKK